MLRTKIGMAVLFYLFTNRMIDYIQLLMKQSDRICHKVILKQLKQRQIYIKRQQGYIEGTPKIIVAKQLQNNVQEIWTDDLRNQPLLRLRELNSNEKAFAYARRIIIACSKLAPKYGFFIINENMIFFNKLREIFVWINPEILENRVKIYLPNTHEGQLTMIRSIITYLKHWLRFDYNCLSEVQSMDELLVRFQVVRMKTLEQNRKKSPDKDFLNLKKAISNTQPRQSHQNKVGFKLQPMKITVENRSTKEIIHKTEKNEESQKIGVKSLPNENQNKSKNYLKIIQSKQERQKLKVKTSVGKDTEQVSQKNAESIEHDFQNKTFNAFPNNSYQSTKISVNKSVGLKSGSNYFPNRTTSNKNHPIVQLINSQNINPDDFGQNKILMSQQKMEEHQRSRKLKESLDGIGQEVNELFLSNIQSEQNKEDIKKIEEEFENILN